MNKTSSNTFKAYMFKFFLRTRIHIAFFLALLGFIVMKSVLKISQKNIGNKIHYSHANKTASITDLYWYVIISISYNVIGLVIELITGITQTTVFSRAFIYFYSKFIDYPFGDWKMTLGGDPYSLIIRRSKGMAGMFKGLFIIVPDNVLYIILGFINLITNHGTPRHFWKAMGLLALFPVMINVFIFVRSAVLRRSNEAYDISEKKIKDIFLNYEMMHTHNTLDREMEKFCENSEDWRKWTILYWILNDFIDLFNNIMRMVVTCVLLRDMLLLTLSSKDISNQISCFTSILKRVKSGTKNIKDALEFSEQAFNSKLDNLRTEPRRMQVPKKSFTTRIQIENVEMHYGDSLVFKNVNFSVQKGEKVAITGPNGSGKSSFVKALIGIEKFKGIVKIDGVETLDIDENDFRSLLTYVPQESYVFEASVYDNLVAFDENIDQGDVVKKSNEFGMHEDMKVIGYDTNLTEKGGNISTVQRQKICLLRAIIRNTPIFIFDEVTSEMDRDYERRLIEAMMEKMKDKTVVMVIHNLDLLNKFDKVVFFNEKTATDCVRLEELEKTNELFRVYRRTSEQIVK